MLLPPWQHAKYGGQTNEYDIQSLKFDFYVYALLFQMKYIPIFIVRKTSRYENNIELNVPTPNMCPPFCNNAASQMLF